MKEIENIIQRYEEARARQEQLVLGTVVKVEGSSYRRIGARLLVSDTGQWVGGISGGCLEGDALKQAQNAMRKAQSSIVVYDTTDDDPHQIGVGLGCNGRIEVLFTPIHSEDTHNQIEFLKKIRHRRQPSVLLQVLRVQKGDCNLVGQFFTERTFGKLAAQTNIPLSEIQTGVATVFHKRKSNIFTLKNAVGKSYEILFEHLRPKIKLVCVGDNYDVHAMLQVADGMGWEVHLVGKTRKVSKALLQQTTAFTDVNASHTIPTDDYTAIVLMSHDYNTDLQQLRVFIRRPVPYIGLLGPKKRMQKMNQALQNTDADIDLATQANLYAPVGLDLGAETPEEIALSIAAEIIAVFRKRAGGFLRQRIGSIHQRV